MVLICKNDQRAFSELYDRYSGPLYRYFFRMLYQDPMLAEDCTQEAFIRIHQKAALFDKSRNFKKWCFALAHNICKNEYRNKSRQPQIERSNGLEKLVLELKIEEQQRPQVDLLQKGLEQLNPNQREIIILKYQEGLTSKEISAVLNCPEGTVKSRLFYALKQLAKKVRIKTVLL